MARKQRNADEFGAWAYDARNALGLSADDVGDALGYHRTGIVRAEGRQRSAQMETQLPAYYQRVARERGVVLPPVPGAKPAAVAPTPDLAALIAAMAAQTETMTRLFEQQSATTAALLVELREGRQERHGLQAQLDLMGAQMARMAERLESMEQENAAGVAAADPPATPKRADGGARS